MSESVMYWIESASAPLVLMDASDFSNWRGAGDLEEKWQGNGLLGYLRSGSGKCFPLLSGSLPTCLIALDARPALLQWVSAPSEADLLGFVREFRESDVAFSDSLPFGAGGKQLRVFDSAVNGEQSENLLGFLCAECTQIVVRRIRGEGVEANLVEFR